MPLDRVCLIFITQPQVDRQPPCGLPVVLNVRCEGDIPKIAIAVGFAVAGACKDAWGTAQERLQTRECIVSVPVCIAVGVDLLPSNTASDFQGVRPFGPKDIIGDCEFVLKKS